MFATAALFVIVALLAIWRAGMSAAGQNHARRLGAASRYAIAELPENTSGRVVGSTGVLDKTLTAPLTGRACVYYEVRVRDCRQNAIIVEERRGVPFVLSGDVRGVVDPEYAEIAVEFDAEAMSGIFDDPTPAEQAVLERNGEHWHLFGFNRALRYEEAVIAIGETIAVLGTAVREIDPDAEPTSYRGELPTRIRLSGSLRFPLLINGKRSTTM